MVASRAGGVVFAAKISYRWGCLCGCVKWWCRRFCVEHSSPLVNLRGGGKSPCNGCVKWWCCHFCVENSLVVCRRVMASSSGGVVAFASKIVGCGVRGVECGVWSVGMECGVWSWSVERGVECGVWRCGGGVRVECGERRVESGE